MPKIKIIENRSEIAAGTRGASLGPEAIKIAALNKGSKFFKKYPIREIQHENHLLFEEVKKIYAKRISGLLRVYERMCEEVSAIIHQQDFPIILSGDHASAGGTMAGIKKAFPGKRMGVAWIDAHADLNSPYTTPSGNIHGMPLAAALAEDNLACKVNDVWQPTIDTWEELKKVGGMAGKISPKDIVYMGVRETDPGELHIITEHKIKILTVQEVREKGAVAIAEKALSALSRCDLIYLSLDVDSLDPEISRGTGTPASGGLNEEELGAMVTTLLANPKTCCFEVVEVNPTLDDKGNKMAEIAFSIIEKAAAAIENRNLDNAT